MPGQNIEVFVEAFGGGGGGALTTGNVGTDGGDTIWDTASEALVTDGGSGADFDNSATTGMSGPKGLYKDSDSNASSTGGAQPATNGSNHYGASIGYNMRGNVGDVKRFSRIVNGDINLTVGAGGVGQNGQVSNSGAIIISYNITTTQTPVVVNMQRRDWEHFGEVSWRTAANTNGQSVTGDTVTTCNLNTEVLDTGNKLTVNGDNTFTLEAGTYEFETIMPIYTAGGTEGSARLYNVTDSELISSNYNSNLGGAGAGWGENILNLGGHFSISSSKTFRLEVVLSSNSGAHVGGYDTPLFSNTDLIDRVKFQFKWRA